MTDDLRMGVAEVDITPPVGTAMAGALEPRPATWICDPLRVKALVLESQGVRLACVVFDLVELTRETGDRFVALASQRTGIPPDHIFWTCTHTHSGPIVGFDWPDETAGDALNRAWFETLPEKFVQAVAAADAARAPVRLSRVRTYHSGLSHNRRLRYKDGREINTWLLNGGEDDLQCIGAAAPIDPEINVLAFEDEAGSLRGVLFHFALHNNACWNGGFSAEFPAVVAARLRERYGAQVSTLFLPGCCGDLNPVHSCRETGDALADAIMAKLDTRKPVAGPIRLDAIRREITLPYRDLTLDQEAQLERTQWYGKGKELFRRNLDYMRRKGVKETTTWVGAWRIGDIGFASLPGEVFCQWGMRLKEKSPFPWTVPVELCNDCVGYLVTRQAWEAGGYEGITSTIAPVDVKGVEALTEQALAMLNELWTRGATP